MKKCNNFKKKDQEHKARAQRGSLIDNNLSDKVQKEQYV
jgi:hypothetical protein